MMLIEGIPLFIMEYALGQRMKQSAVRVWNNVHPVFFGVGLGCVLVSFAMCLYYIVIITWCVYYFFVSFTSNLPWKLENCPGYPSYSRILSNYTAYDAIQNKTGEQINATKLLLSLKNNFPDCCVHNPAEFYWYQRALTVSTGMDSTGGGINWKLFGCLFVGWVVTYLCVLKGVKSSGKVRVKICSYISILYFLQYFCFTMHDL